MQRSFRDRPPDFTFTLKLVDDNDTPDVLMAHYLRTFTQKLRDFRKADGAVLEYDIRIEFRRQQPHAHLTVITSLEWSRNGIKELVKGWWAMSCPDRQTAVYCDRVRNVPGLANYVTKNVKDRSKVDILQPNETISAKHLPSASGERVHLAGVWDGKEPRLFVDGKPVKNVNRGKWPSGNAGTPSQVLLGAVLLQGKMHNAFSGSMYGVRISRMARYQQAFVPEKCFARDDATVALYHFEEGEGDQLKDSSGNGHHGKIVGAKWVKTESLPTGAPGRAAEVPWLAADKLGPEATRFLIEEPVKLVGMHVRRKAGQATSVKILEIDNPPLASHVYKMHGRIRYEKVEGVGHVEMWSQFADGQAYFTKTLGEVGPMGKLQGTSDWRDLELPFFSKPEMLPKKLWVNVVLPGAGAVYLEPLRLSPTNREIKGQGEETPQADPDRKAAEWVLSLGGTVEVNEENRAIKAAGDLPRGRFSLTHVDLSDKPIADDDLARLKDLKGLTGLQLTGAKVTDAGLAHLKGFKGLRNLWLYKTMVTDIGLAHLKELKGLSLLFLDETAVTDAGLEHLKGLVGLKTLWLGFTSVTDAGLVHLKDMKGLSLLSLSNTGVTDAGLKQLRELTGLSKLWLRGTKVTDAGLVQLKGFKEMRELYLERTEVTDAGLAHLKDLGGLTLLGLKKTAVTAKGLADFHAAVPGCKIEHDGGTLELKK